MFLPKQYTKEKANTTRSKGRSIEITLYVFESKLAGKIGIIRFVKQLEKSSNAVVEIKNKYFLASKKKYTIAEITTRLIITNTILARYFKTAW
jgi:hypothetical protein